jgi:hypothetical protein
LSPENANFKGEEKIVEPPKISLMSYAFSEPLFMGSVFLLETFLMAKRFLHSYFIVETMAIPFRLCVCDSER